MGTVIHYDFRNRTRAARPYREHATVRTLAGRFCDKVLFAVMPRGNGFKALQFNAEANPMALDREKPVAAMNLTQDELARHFEMQSPDSLCDLTPHFQSIANMTPHPDDGQALYGRKIRAVHIIDAPGLFQPGGTDTARHYAQGDAVIVYEQGQIAAGPARVMLAGVTPVDRDARIALQAALETLPPSPPSGFDF